MKYLYTLLLHFCLVVNASAQWTNTGPSGQSLSSISFYDATNGWICGAQGTLFRTTNGGNIWQPITYFNASTARNRLIAIANPQPTRIVLLAEQASATQPVIAYLSQNNGTSWGAIDNGSFNNLYFYGTTQGLLVGDGGTLRISISGGALWTAVSSGTQNNLRDGYCTSSQDCYVVGDGGTLRKSVNGITTWRALNSTTSTRLNGIHFPTTTQGYIIGDNGTALRTFDAGATWASMPVGTSANLNDVYFLDASVGFIVGDFGTILLTTNGGTSWSAETTNTFESLYSIAAAADGSVIRVAGSGGTVLKRGPVVLGVRNKAQFADWQAFPNPFNSTLKIALPSNLKEGCQLRLLNSLGQLVHHESVIGTESQQEFVIPNNLPSGAYFVQLQSGQICETRHLMHIQ